MLESFLEGVNYYDFPSLEVAIFSLLLAFTLSSAIALTFHFTFQGSHFPNYFFQAIVLSSIVTSMIIMSAHLPWACPCSRRKACGFVGQDRWCSGRSVPHREIVRFLLGKGGCIVNVVVRMGMSESTSRMATPRDQIRSDLLLAWRQPDST